MSTINIYPVRLMRGMATGELRDDGEIWRNDGYGWEMLLTTKLNIHHPRVQPVPADPTDASSAQAMIVEIHFGWDTPVRIGDHVKKVGAGSHVWTIGSGSFEETFGSYVKTLASRPVAATPRVWITLQRWNSSLGTFQNLPPQLVQVAWSRNQPDRLGGVAIRQFGWIFAPEEAAVQLDVQQGDTFFYGGVSNIVTWVPPDPSDRREAIFSANIGEGT